MKSFIKIALVSLPLFLAAPTFAQVSWGVDLRFGTPPPREVIVERPYQDAVWEPGYYREGPEYQHVWMPGRWHPHNWVSQEHRYDGRDGQRGFDRGRNSDRGEDRRSYSQGEDRGRGQNDQRSNRQGENRGQGGEQRSEGRTR
jgi:hypothetical protein